MLELDGFSITAREPDATTALNIIPAGKMHALSFSTSVQGGFKECTFTLSGAALHMLEWYYVLGKRIIVKGPDGRTVWEGIVSHLQYSHGITYDLSTMKNAVLVQYSDAYLTGAETSWATDSDSQDRFGIHEHVESVSGASSATADRIRDLILYFSLRTLGANPFVAPQPPPPSELTLQVTAFGLYSTLAWERWQDTTQGDVDTGTQIISICAGRSGSGNGYIDTSAIPTTGISEPRYRPDQYQTLRQEVERLASMGDSNDDMLWFQVWEDRLASLEIRGGTNGKFPDPDYYQHGQFISDANGRRIQKYHVRADKVISTPGFQPLGFGWEADILEQPRAVYILETRYNIPSHMLDISPAGWREWAQIAGRAGLISTRGRGGFIDPIVAPEDPYDPRKTQPRKRAPVRKCVAKSANYTLGLEGGCDGTGGAGGITITLPPAADAEDREYTVKKVDAGAGPVTLDGNGAETIDGAANQALANQYDCITVRSDGSEWFIIADNR